MVKNHPNHGAFVINESVYGISWAIGVAAWAGISLRLILSGSPLRVGQYPLDKGVAVQLLRVHHLAVDDAPPGQFLPDGNGVNAVKIVLLGLGVEAVLPDELGNPALDLGPGHVSRRAVYRHGEGGQVVSVLLPQPGGGALLPPVLLHVADDGVFALDAAVPLLDGGVDAGLRDRSGRLGPFRHLRLGFHGRRLRLNGLRRGLHGRYLRLNGLRRGLRCGLFPALGDLLLHQQGDLRPGQLGRGGGSEIIPLPHMKLVREAPETDGGPVPGWVLMQDLSEPQAEVAGPQRFLRVVREELNQGLPGGRPVLVVQNLGEILPPEGRRGNGVRRGCRRTCRWGVQGQLLRAVGRRIRHTGHRRGQRLSPLLELPYHGVPAFLFLWRKVVLAGHKLLQPGGGPVPCN